MLFVLQILESTVEWNAIPSIMRPDTKNLTQHLIQSKAKSTSKRYLEEIRKFIKWTKFFDIQVKPPLSVPLCITYLSHRYNESKSYATLVICHAALK